MFDEIAIKMHLDELENEYIFTDYQRRALHLAMMIAEDVKIPISYKGDLAKYCDDNHTWCGEIKSRQEKDKTE